MLKRTKMKGWDFSNLHLTFTESDLLYWRSRFNILYYYIDFGLSKESIYDEKKAFSFCGTVEYMAPEVCKN